MEIRCKVSNKKNEHDCYVNLTQPGPFFTTPGGPITCWLNKPRGGFPLSSYAITPPLIEPLSTRGVRGPGRGIQRQGDEGVGLPTGRGGAVGLPKN